MTFPVRILQQARDDIDRNANWWANHHSIDQALQWSDAVYDQLEMLREFPERHPLASENDEFSYEIREKLVGLGSRPGYRAIFTIKDDEVFILTVRAGEEDRLTTDEGRGSVRSLVLAISNSPFAQPVESSDAAKLRQHLRQIDDTSRAHLPRGAWSVQTD